MLVIPAIDLRNGKCVRLVHGDSAQEKVYSDNPVDTAKKWVNAGCKRLHVIDLDGAFEGEPRNLEWVLRIKKETKAFIQMGGGLRTLQSIKAILAAGIDRVILGTIVFEEAGLAQSAFEEYKDQIMVALDVRDGMVAKRGWTQSSGFPLPDALIMVEKLGGKEIIYTDISRDGTLGGVNAQFVQQVALLTKLKIYASGGVSSLEDIQKLKKINSPGCIVGKAIYEGTLDLKEALKIAEN